MLGFSSGVVEAQSVRLSDGGQGGAHRGKRKARTHSYAAAAPTTCSHARSACSSICGNGGGINRRICS